LQKAARGNLDNAIELRPVAVASYSEMGGPDAANGRN
jgi:hypothetical protein